MASAKDLRKRITSVKNTQQITRAMKMVSAAKLRRAQENITSLRPYAHELNKVIAELAGGVDLESMHPLLAKREEKPAKKLLLVLVTSDRGLCGAFNAGIIKAAFRFERAHRQNYEKIDFAFIGKKGYEFFKGKKDGKYYSDFLQKLNYPYASKVSQEFIESYLNGEYDEIKILYTEYKSALTQKVQMEAFLPIQKAVGEEAEVAESFPTIYEPGAREILEGLLPRHFAYQVLRMARESLASEHAARMTAMENATKNAGEMIRKITLLYNKTRQAGITKELLEIVSGAEAQKN